MKPRTCLISIGRIDAGNVVSFNLDFVDIELYDLSVLVRLLLDFM